MEVDKNNQTQKRILIVDDVSINIEVLAEALGRDYEVMSSTEGRRALAMTKGHNPPDIILLDIEMPGMNGYEVLAQLKSNERTSHIPVIFITAKSETESEVKGLALGAVDYITKPFNPAVVQARVKTHLMLEDARRELAKQNDILKESMRLRETVESMTRHDLKGPLSPILYYPEVLMEELIMGDEHIDMLKAVRDSGYRILDMINRSMDMYKMEAGTYQYKPKPADLAQIFEGVSIEIEKLLKSFGLKLSVRIEGRTTVKGEAYLVSVEDTLLLSMLSNLLKNAAEASPKGGTISLLGQRTGQQLEIVIKNQGVVPLEIRDRFFEKYATKGKDKGTGLGTYSAKLCATTMGGEIRMATSEDEGTTITVVIPCFEDEEMIG